MSQRVLETDEVMERALKDSQRLEEQIRLLLVYKEIITGKGLEFERLRQYVPGDEARMIDWNSLARTNKLYTRIFKEERMLDVVFAVDTTKSMGTGATELLKTDYASIVTVSLARTVLKAGDKAGMVVFSDSIGEMVETSYEEEMPYSMAKKLSETELSGENVDWRALRDQIVNNFGQDTFVFVISDFVDESDEMYEFLEVCNEKFRGVFTLMIRDPLDTELPEGVGKAYLSSPDSSETQLVDVDDARERYNERAAEQESRIEKRVESTGGYFFKLQTDEDFVEKLATSLDRRQELWN